MKTTAAQRRAKREMMKVLRSPAKKKRAKKAVDAKSAEPRTCTTSKAFVKNGVTKLERSGPTTIEQFIQCMVSFKGPQKLAAQAHMPKSTVHKRGRNPLECKISEFIKIANTPHGLNIPAAWSEAINTLISQ